MSGPGAMTLVEARGLRLGYGARVVAECPDFTVCEGDFLCIVGANGSGKSTLVKSMAGLVEPLGGSLSLAKGLQDGGIGYVPQQGPAQRGFPASVREVVMSGCQSSRGWRPFYTAAECRRAARAMVRLGIATLAKRSYLELSGGQRQRVLLARALCAERRLLLLDEPANGLDPEASADLYATLRFVNSEGLAVAMVTHDIASALRCATHVLRLGEGAAFERRRADG